MTRLDEAAMRIGTELAARLREASPDTPIAFFGLYAALNSEHLYATGATYTMGAEAEIPLLDLALHLRDGGRIYAATM